MFDPDRGGAVRAYVNSGSCRANWESDVCDISIERCKIGKRPVWPALQMVLYGE